MHMDLRIQSLIRKREILLPSSYFLILQYFSLVVARYRLTFGTVAGTETIRNC